MMLVVYGHDVGSVLSRLIHIDQLVFYTAINSYLFFSFVQ